MQDTAERLLEKPKFKQFTVAGMNVKATSYWSRATGHVHVRLERAGRAETVVFPSTGNEELDERIVFLVLLSWSGIAQFKLNTIRRSPVYRAIVHLKTRCPRLTSNDPVDAIITEFLLYHNPTAVILPAGREYAGLVPRLMRAGLTDPPSMEELEDTKPADSYVEAISILHTGYMRVENEEPGTVFPAVLVEKLYTKHYPDVMRRSRGLLREMLRDLTRIFVYEHIVRAVSNIEQTSRTVRKLVSKYTGGLVDAYFERTGTGDYRLNVVLHVPGVEPAELQEELDTDGLIEFLYNVLRRSKDHGSMRGVYTTILRLLEDNVEAETLTGRETLHFIFEPGRLYVLGEDGRVLGFNSLETFRTRMRGIVRSDTEGPFSYKSLYRLGDEFYGSPTLRRAVSITGCITCEKHELLNETLALSTDGRTWHAGVLVEDKSLRATGRDPKTALLGLTDVLITSHANVENVEKYAPEIVALKRALHVIDREAEQDGKHLVFRKDPVIGTITFVLDMTMMRPIMIVLPADNVEDDEWAAVSFLDSNDTWNRLDPAPEYVARALTENGFKPKPKRKTRMIYRNGNIYVLLRRR